VDNAVAQIARQHPVYNINNLLNAIQFVGARIDFSDRAVLIDNIETILFVSIQLQEMLLIIFFLKRHRKHLMEQ